VRSPGLSSPYIDQDNVIASLRKELAAQQSLASEAKGLRTQLASAQAENEHLGSEIKRMGSEIKSLKNVQTEVKTLQAKLAATRAQSESAVASKAPSSSANSKAANKIEDNQSWKMKEDLYCDLTGLMIHSVKRVEGEDVFDCIQTGKNGSKLILDMTRSLMLMSIQLYDSISL